MGTFWTTYPPHFVFVDIEPPPAPLLINAKAPNFEKAKKVGFLVEVTVNVIKG